MKESITYRAIILIGIFFSVLLQETALAWHDETHIAIAKAAGYRKWYNAAGADMVKIKLGKREGLNHFASSPQGTRITADDVLGQAEKYDRLGFSGHLYGAVIASLRNYIAERAEGRYAEYHLAFCAHYVGDLSQPLHNTLYNDYNEKFHARTDGVINREVLNNLDKIKIYPITITSEKDLAGHVARIANLSIRKGYALEREGRMLSKAEAYVQMSHSASLFAAIMEFAETQLAASGGNP